MMTFVLSDFLDKTERECNSYEYLYRYVMIWTLYILRCIYNGFFDLNLLLNNELGVSINLQQWCEPVIIVVFETVVELE